MENKAAQFKENDKNIIREGKAEILVQDANVFYNHVQEFNRDLRYICEFAKQFKFRI